MLRSLKSRVGTCALAAMIVGASVVLAGPAVADSVYHSAHYNLTAVNAAPLRSGFVENIHANGPIVYAHEQYVLNGAAPNTTYHVVLMIFPGDTTCSGTPAVTIPTATIHTNAAGNGVAYHVFTPADADGLRGATVARYGPSPRVVRPTTRPGARPSPWTESDSRGSASAGPEPRLRQHPQETRRRQRPGAAY